MKLKHLLKKVTGLFTRKYAKDYKLDELNQAYKSMKSECLEPWVSKAFELAWRDFKANKFSYDGATFVQEVGDNYFEVAAFIHDWLNVMGYVGKEVDLYFIDVMRACKYPSNIIFERCKWMQYTWINVLLHRIKGNKTVNKIPYKLCKDVVL